ncbi:MAG: YihY family inner membrane protein, partial [Natronospirillum sp.]
MIVQWYKPEVVWQFICYVFKSFSHHQGLENAKSLTFTSLFAVVPLFTLLITMLSAFPQFQEVGTQVQEALFERLLPSSSDELQAHIQSFATQARNLTWVGALMLLGTSYLMLVNIEQNFNAIWGVGQLRKGLASFLLYWSVLSL